jgi:hypothetical protein
MFFAKTRAQPVARMPMFVIVRLNRTIQYSATPAMESRTRGVLDTRRSLSSGAHSRDPVAGMTAVAGANAFYYK